jgi:quinolinate synthase
MLITIDNKLSQFNNLKSNFLNKKLLDFSTVHYYYLILILKKNNKYYCMNDNNFKPAGFLNIPVPKDLDLASAIHDLKVKKNAVILAHYYQKTEIQDIADYVGDSLALAQWASKTSADCIVLCGVHFMAETAKIISPEKRVFVPDLNAGCSLADSCPAEDFERFIKQHPGHTVISYVNTTAAVKTLTDVVVTSTNARRIVESFPPETKIIFGPDENLGNYINSLTGRNMVLWKGACHVHEQFSLEKIVTLKKENPDALV